MNKIKISVCIITFDEEKNIRACLESVKWAEEIIIVDSFSQDKTIEICKEYTDKIYQVDWEGFGKTKNLALSYATQPWILSLDADERVNEALKDEILAIDQRSDGYFIPRKSFFGGKWIKYCGWYPDYTIRLIKNGHGKFKEQKVHEAIEIKGNVVYLKCPLIHYTYKDITDFVRRLNRYSTLSAEEKTGLSRISLFLSLLFLKKDF
ncbi:glycosyltransferase family 2 protein [Candidatus Auribacterota bacterium]